MLRLQDIMTRDVVTVSPELTLRDAMELLTSLHISGAPVVGNRFATRCIARWRASPFELVLPSWPESLDDVGDFRIEK